VIVTLVGIEAGDRQAFLGTEQFGEDGTAKAVEFGGERLPIIGGDPRLCRYTGRESGEDGDDGTHALVSFSRRTRFRSIPQR